MEEKTKLKKLNNTPPLCTLVIMSVGLGVGLAGLASLACSQQPCLPLHVLACLQHSAPVPTPDPYTELLINWGSQKHRETE